MIIFKLKTIFPDFFFILFPLGPYPHSSSQAFYLQELREFIWESKEEQKERAGAREREGETLLIFMHQELRHLGPYKGHTGKTTN